MQPVKTSLEVKPDFVFEIRAYVREAYNCTITSMPPSIDGRVRLLLPQCIHPHHRQRRRRRRRRGEWTTEWMECQPSLWREGRKEGRLAVARTGGRVGAAVGCMESMDGRGRSGA